MLVNPETAETLPGDLSHEDADAEEAQDVRVELQEGYDGEVPVLYVAVQNQRLKEVHEKAGGSTSETTTTRRSGRGGATGGVQRVEVSGLESGGISPSIC